MNKGELVNEVANRVGATKAVTAQILDMFTDIVIEALKNGDQVVFPGFGTFATGNRAARSGRNPQTGEVLQIKAARVAKFKAGKALKEAVQDA